MAFIHIPNVHIKGISACVPSKIIKNETLTDIFSKEELDKIINSVGIIERRIVDRETTASDLCFKAAENLLNKLDIDRESIDVLIFMSQTGDYKIPATASILQHRLKLSQNCACFDVSLACSGYVYALTTAFSYLNLEGINRVLLLDGETFSKIVNPKDKTNALLYGDAGTATLLEKKQGIDFYSLLKTDGTGWEAVNIKSGGCRNVTTLDSFVEYEREDGSIGNDQQVYMNGLDVFNFTMKVVPKSVKEILEKYNFELTDMDKIVFHQANKFMTDFFVKKLKYPKENVPYSLQKYGNVSSATIPLTISSELYHWESDRKQLLISGFGAGLSWATAIINLEDTHIFKPIEY
ncbi:3-oxoacyl-ACP synthase III family protein [Capnocytophaga canimorsus]|uniref:3-oxoacyl-ACP synthase III family protein n=1 Tax=Capnocytophaga canimorsus TaxID=28188 RepID=UPI000D6E4208|nr:ketoacyl-ACP synthase III [Capnocytophaga canimorsus]AWL78740.1 3-oxoacyl-ACP synthase [Capnocytophaga canimorsus]AYW37350.1 ketoacyl-ACP synthase III [Capnocytophaga canimorsus]MDT9500123.1 ketoacyl-ACP synthase III [Capnocytophaga canimorsus]